MRKIKVMVFDDEEMIRNIYKTALRDRDYEILDFSDPSVCNVYKNPICNCGKDRCADIIITDIIMPNVDGLTFLKLQKSRDCKVKHVIVASAYIDTKIEKEITDIGGCRYLKKPFSIDKFLEIIDEFEANIRNEDGI